MTYVLMVWGNARGIGGTESRMAEVITAWARRGERVVSAVQYEETKTRLHDLLEASGSELLPTDRVRVINEWVSRHSPRLIIAFGLRASLLVRACRLHACIRRRPWPSTLDARNGLEAGRGRFLWLLDRFTQRLVDVYVTNSDAAAANLVTHGVAPSRLRVVYSALGDSWQQVVPTEPRERASVAMVGNARREKQHHLGLQLFAKLKEPATLTIYTDDASELRRQWAGLASTAVGTVVFREGHPVTPEDLRRTAIMLHPSSHESAPRCLMEGRASGCHVVAFDVGDTRRVVGDGGEIVPPRDSEALFAALEWAVSASVGGTLAQTPAKFPSVQEYTSELDSIGTVS